MGSGSGWVRGGRRGWGGKARGLRLRLGGGAVDRVGIGHKFVLAVSGTGLKNNKR